MGKPKPDVEWIKGCEICNIGLVIRFNELKKQGLSDRHVCRLMAIEASTGKCHRSGTQTPVEPMRQCKRSMTSTRRFYKENPIKFQNQEVCYGRL